MRRRKSALKIALTATHRAILLSWLRSQKTPVGRAKRDYWSAFTLIGNPW